MLTYAQGLGIYMLFNRENAPEYGEEYTKNSSVPEESVKVP